MSALGQQTNQEKIYGKWKLEEFEIEKHFSNSDKIQNELKDIILSFEKGVIVISKRNECVDQFIKSGPYSLSGDNLIIGEDKGEILLLNDQQLKIRVEGQAILYFIKS